MWDASRPRRDGARDGIIPARVAADPLHAPFDPPELGQTRRERVGGDAGRSHRRPVARRRPRRPDARKPARGARSSAPCPLGAPVRAAPRPADPRRPARVGRGAGRGRRHRVPSSPRGPARRGVGASGPHQAPHRPGPLPNPLRRVPARSASSRSIGGMPAVAPNPVTGPPRCVPRPPPGAPGSDGVRGHPGARAGHDRVAASWRLCVVASSGGGRPVRPGRGRLPRARAGAGRDRPAAAVPGRRVNPPPRRRPG